MKPKIFRALWDCFSKTFPRVSCEIDFARRNRYFECDLWIIPQFCASDKTALDIGTNCGIHARWMAKHSRRVECFECNPQLHSRLKAFLPSNARLHTCALSNSEGSAELRFDPRNTGIGTIETRNLLDQNEGICKIDTSVVSTRTLDSFEFSDVTFAKIDVEGHELHVLEGATHLLTRCHPVLMIEIEERHCPGNLRAVPAHLAEFGYSPFALASKGDQLTPVPDAEEASARGIINFWFLPGEYKDLR